MPQLPQLCLRTLPIELLYEIQLFALSEHLPHTCHHLHQVYKLAPNSFHAQYILGRFHALPSSSSSSIVTRSLRYPLCNENVLEVILHHPACPSIRGSTELPRRLFRFTKRWKGSRSVPWNENDAPLPFLRYLYNHPRFVPPNTNSHGGYALIKAVSANFIPLVRFLLQHDASPNCTGSLPIMIAIQRKDLSMVRLLIERGYGEESTKKRRLDDRVPSTLEMLKRAIKHEAENVAKYFMDEKYLVPDLETISLLHLVEAEKGIPNKSPKKR